VTGVPETNLAKRAAAILREEIAAGALGNIAQSNRIWLASRRDRFGSHLVRHVRTDIEQLVQALLDVLPPNPDITVLRPLSPIRRGQTGGIRAWLANSTSDPSDLQFICSDLAGDSGGYMRANCVRISPQPLHLPAGQVVQLDLTVCIPGDVSPGVYRATLQAADCPTLRAVVSVPVV
jgi:hypothetical protein